MATKDLLLEIGVEEIPDWMIVDGLAHLTAKLTELVAQLGGKVTLADATPRRLVVKHRQTVLFQSLHHFVGIAIPLHRNHAGSVQHLLRMSLKFHQLAKHDVVDHFER